MKPALRDRTQLLPASGIPLLYLAFAHACLALALAALALNPSLPAGFFHLRRMVAVVHLVTLGWISSSILGGFHIVAPLALRGCRFGRTGRTGLASARAWWRRGPSGDHPWRRETGPRPRRVRAYHA